MVNGKLSGHVRFVSNASFEHDGRIHCMTYSADKEFCKLNIMLETGLDLSFAGSQGEYHCMWRCPRPGLNPSGLVNNSSLAAGPQFTEVKIL